MYTLFVIILGFVPAEVAIDGQEGWKHAYSVNHGQYETLEECAAAGLEVQVLSYPGLPSYNLKCVKGWSK